MKIFSRNKKTEEVTTVSERIADYDDYGIECDTPELKEILNQWLEHLRWEKVDFLSCLEQIGVKTPVKLKWNTLLQGFNCLTASGTEVVINLEFGSFGELDPEISVQEDSQKREYIAHYWTKRRGSKSLVTLKKTVLISGKKELTSYYYPCELCKANLKIDDNHYININIERPNKWDYDKTESLILEKREDIENYLISVDNNHIIGVEGIYSHILNCLGISEDQIYNTTKLIEHVKMVDEEKHILAKMLSKDNEMKEYAITEKGETYHLFRNGNYIYTSEKIKISYDASNNDYIFSIKGKDIENFNLIEITDRVKEKISEMWKFVK